VALLSQAAAAVKKYPLPLSSGEEAMILDNIGKYLELQCLTCEPKIPVPSTTY